MKKMFILLLLLLLLLPLTVFAADRNLPEEILSVFQVPEWEGYAIPIIPEDQPYGGALASYYYDENNHAAAIAILKKDDENVLCLLEKNNGAWTIVTQSITAIKQGDEVPLISSETYDEFYIHYLRSDNQPYLGMTIRKQTNQWTVAEISYFPDDVYVYVQIDENELRYAGDETNWEQVIVGGHIENNLELFSLDDFPLTIEAAQEMFLENSDE